MINITQPSGYFYDKATIQRSLNRLKVPTLKDLSGFEVSQSKINRFLWLAEKTVFGRFLEPHFQLLGDCTGHALSTGLTSLLCSKIHFNGENSKLSKEVDHQSLYAGGRVNIGGGSVPAHIDGCYLIWAIEFAQKFGILLRRNYVKAGYDLGNYIRDIGIVWGSPGVGVPQSLLYHASKHKLTSFARVTQPEEVIHSVVNLARPIVLATDYRVVLSSDEYGFCTPDSILHGHAVAVVGHFVDHRGISAIVVKESAGGYPMNAPKEYLLQNGKTMLRNPGTYLLTYDSFRFLLGRGEAYSLLDAQGF